MIAVAMLTLASACTQTATVCADADNQVIAAIMSRRSIRHYKPEPVPRELMNRIVECGINAPSGMNRQPWEIRVVDNSAMLDTISKLQLQMLDSTRRAQMESQPGFRNIFRNAPTVAFIACPADGGQLDCGMLCQNMMIAAQSLGIGSCCLGGPIRFLKTDEARFFVEQLGFSPEYQLLLAIGFGYPDEAPEAKPRDASKARYVN